MTIGTSDGQQFEDQFQHALAVGEPAYHPPEWRGNKWYSPAYKVAEQGRGVILANTESGAPESAVPENINPDYVPDMTMGGFNRVASTSSTMPLRATEKPTGEPKSNLGTQVAMDEHIKDYSPADALQATQTGTSAAPRSAERIVVPAVRDLQGKIYPGFTNHTEAMQAAKSAGKSSKDLDQTTFGGFLTNKGNYLDRKEALELAKKNGQYLSHWGDGDPIFNEGPLKDMLMSHQVDWGYTGTRRK